MKKNILVVSAASLKNSVCLSPLDQRCYSVVGPSNLYENNGDLSLEVVVFRFREGVSEIAIINDT